MNLLLVIIVSSLSLFGCDGGSHHVQRVFRLDDGVILYSKIRMDARDAEFKCVRTASGQCHYTVSGPGCQPATAGAGAAACGERAPQRFVLAKGDSRVVRDLPPSRVCISELAEDPVPECGLVGRPL